MKCNNCGSTLYDEAIRCHVCMSWFNWRKHYEFVILLIGAFLSVTALYSAGVKPTFELLASKKPELIAEVLSSSLDKTTLMLANRGTLPAGIKEIYFHVESSGGFNVPAGKEKWGTLLKENEVMSVTLGIVNSYLPVIANKGHVGYKSMPKVNCSLIVEYTAFEKKETQPYRKDLECYGISPSPKFTESEKYK